MNTKGGKDQRRDQREVEEESSQVFEAGFSLDKVPEKHACLGDERKEDAGKSGSRPSWIVAVQQLNEGEHVGEDVDGRQDCVEEYEQKSFALTYHLLQFWVLEASLVFVVLICRDL